MISREMLAPAIRRISDSPGLIFKNADWQQLHDTGAANSLLRVAPSDGAVAPNTLHVIRLEKADADSVAQLAVGWNSSLVELSCEIEGHSLGGGMLKLEPGEAERVALPRLRNDAGLASELDAMARALRATAVADRADVEMCDELGLSRVDVRRLKDGAALLRNRRTGR